MADSPEAPVTAEAPAKRAPSKRAQRLAKGITLGVTLLLCFGLCEAVFRTLENREKAQEYSHGPGGQPMPDARWGWKMSPGHFEQGTNEFQVTGDMNDRFMNDDPIDMTADAGKTRVLALGDSHTWAVGASKDQTWAKVLQRDLIAATGKPYRTFNAGCPGYNLHQYLLRLIDQGPELKPDYVVVGFSYATDLYDLLPPERGGWVYGGPTQPRDYFDFDETGALTQRHWEPSAATVAGTAPRVVTGPMKVRAFVEQFATARYLRRSRLALYIGSHVTVGGQSLWPNMDVVLEKQVSPVHEYSWRLAKALLLRMKIESEKLGAKLVVVGIPYLPQVYDELWDSTFGGKDQYSKTAAIERVRAICDENGIVYVDTLDALHERAQKVGHWLHYHRDAHPTAEGQEVIAEVIARSGALPPIEGR